ncbi:hypothetical protein AAHA92_09698 [Salvia divinorum]|uniref:Uncharacterized protein n=1 Tax=Salvia divinorum TaxID=28513 RepID=A0ABD1HWB6_SALDI
MGSGGGGRQGSQIYVGSHCNENNYHPSFEDFLGSELPPNISPDVENHNSSEAHSEQQVSTIKSGSSKHKLSPSDDTLMEFLRYLHAQTNSHLDIIFSRIGYEFDLGEARQEVFDKLGTMDGLTLDQRYELCDVLGDKPQRIEVFIGMPANAKLAPATNITGILNHRSLCART